MLETPLASRIASWDVDFSAARWAELGISRAGGEDLSAFLLAALELWLAALPVVLRAELGISRAGGDDSEAAPASGDSLYEAFSTGFTFFTTRKGSGSRMPRWVTDLPIWPFTTRLSIRVIQPERVPPGGEDAPL